MANATNTVAGDVQLSGDLGGNNDATSPALTVSGVTAGSYTAPNLVIDGKGRITSAASNSVLGPATTSALGVVQIGANIAVSAGIISTGANVPLLNTTNTFTKAQKVTPSALTSGTSIAVDASLSNIYTLTLAHNATLSNPTNLGAGRYTFIITQDGTGSRTLAFGSAYKFASGADTAISSGANTVSVLTCVSNGTNLFSSLAKNFV